MISKILVTIMLLGSILSPLVSTVYATDVWVAHESSENTDIYIMDDTFSCGVSKTGKWFDISGKIVRNGKLKEVKTWHFSKYQGNMWRYYSNTMQRGHDTVVGAPNRVFEYGMRQANWYYEIGNRFYYY